MENVYIPVNTLTENASTLIKDGETFPNPSITANGTYIFPPHRGSYVYHSVDVTYTLDGDELVSSFDCAWHDDSESIDSVLRNSEQEVVVETHHHEYDNHEVIEVGDYKVICRDVVVDKDADVRVIVGDLYNKTLVRFPSGLTLWQAGDPFRLAAAMTLRLKS